MTREEAVKSLLEMRDGMPFDKCRDWIEAISMAICAMEKQPSTQQWILCSERLPEKPKNYPHCEICRTWFLVSLKSGCVKSLAYEFDRDEWQVTGSPVLAWMPLPQPWKEGKDADSD